MISAITIMWDGHIMIFIGGRHRCHWCGMLPTFPVKMLNICCWFAEAMISFSSSSVHLPKFYSFLDWVLSRGLLRYVIRWLWVGSTPSPISVAACLGSTTPPVWVLGVWCQGLVLMATPPLLWALVVMALACVASGSCSFLSRRCHCFGRFLCIAGLWLSEKVLRRSHMSISSAEPPPLLLHDSSEPFLRSNTGRK